MDGLFGQGLHLVAHQDTFDHNLYRRSFQLVFDLSGQAAGHTQQLPRYRVDLAFFLFDEYPKAAGHHCALRSRRLNTPAALHLLEGRLTAASHAQLGGIDHLAGRVLFGRADFEDHGGRPFRPILRDVEARPGFRASRPPARS